MPHRVSVDTGATPQTIAGELGRPATLKFQRRAGAVARWRVLRIVALLLFVGACNSRPPTAPSIVSPGTSPGALICPADIKQSSPDGRSVQVRYPMPALAGQPIEKGVCSPPSGSQFPSGSTTRVTCQASQVPDLVNACSFDVTIVPTPRISKTKFMAFGDSITQGRISCDACSGDFSFGARWLPFDSRDLQLNRPFVVPPETSYPTRLREMLTQRYPVQEVSVLNLGIGGEKASEGRRRLAGELDAFRPDVLLLLEGVNDIDLSIVLSPGKPVPVTPIASELRGMVEIAQSRGVEVLLATLTPVTNDREERSVGFQAAIAGLNVEIRRVATERQLGPVVDLFAALSADPLFIGEDGLHPSVAGYGIIAETFLAAIRQRFETTPTPQSR